MTNKIIRFLWFQEGKKGSVKINNNIDRKLYIYIDDIIFWFDSWGILKYSDNKWHKISFGRRLTKIVPKWLIIITIIAAICLFYGLLWELKEEKYEDFVYHVSTPIFVIIIVFISEFILKDKNLNGYFIKISSDTTELINAISTELDRLEYKYRRIPIPRRLRKKMPTLFIIDTPPFKIRLLIWKSDKKTRIHIGLNFYKNKKFNKEFLCMIKNIIISISRDNESQA